MEAQPGRLVRGIIYRDGHILAVRGTGDPESGPWGLPGGTVRSNESSAEALRREVRERLGCELQLVWLYDSEDGNGAASGRDSFVCTLAPLAEPAPADAHLELRWLSRDELLDVSWSAADEPLARGLGLFWDEAFSEGHL